MKSRLKSLKRHLADVAATSGTLTPEGFVFDRITIKPPPHLVGRPDVVERLNALATIAAASTRVEKPAKKKALENKIYNLVGGLKDPHIRALLDAYFGRNETAAMLDEIELALGYRKTAYKTTVTYTAPKITPEELAFLVMEELKEHGGFEVNTSKDGLLVETLKSIQAASGFRTNAEHYACKVCK